MRRAGIVWALAAAAAAFGATACGDDGGGGGGDAGADADTDTDADADGGADAGDTDADCTEADLYWIWDLSVMPPTDTQVCAHLRGEGEHVRVLVADAAWGATVHQDTVDGLIAAWDDATPADPDRGIFEIVTAAFGDPPDAFDDDPRIWLFLYEMEGYGGYTFDGYFKVDDQTGGATSNRHEMLHINSLNNPPDGDYSLSVQAHELQHLIHYGFDPNEDPWLNEALSEVAMVLTGFGADEGWVESWLSDPASGALLSNGPDYPYGLFLLFGDYVYERLGGEFVAALVADPADGADSLAALLGALETPIAFPDLLADLGLAIAANDPALGEEYAFALIDPGQPDYAPLTTSMEVSAVVPGDGGYLFIQSPAGVDGLTLRVATPAWESLGARAAFVGGDAGALVDVALTGAETDIALGAWPDGADLWIALSNPAGADAAVEAAFVSK